MSRVTDFPEDERPSRTDEGVEEGGKTGIKLPRLPLTQRISDFYHGVKLEMRKTAWPTKTEVWSTTVVVVIAVVFFGFYLWGIDQVITLGFQYLDKMIGGLG
jgi:preprotein translocase subunit SecE